MREIARFSPGLTVGLYHGAGRSLAEREEMPDVTLTTYGTLRRDAEILGTRRWRLLVLDEAQAVKNASTNQSVAVRSIHAPQVIAMTGTPVENRLMEYWSILEIVQPRLLGSADDFARTFAAPIEYERDAHAIEALPAAHRRPSCCAASRATSQSSPTSPRKTASISLRR